MGNRDRSIVPAVVGLGLAVLLGVCLPTSSRAQSATDALFFSNRLPATGPRLSALGGASLAGIADYGALYSNPAGLGYFESSELAGSFRTLLTRDETSYTTSFQQSLDGPVTSVTNTSEDLRTGYGFGNAALVYKLPTQQGSLVFAAAINETRSFDRSFDYQNRNQLSSISDYFLPLNDEVNVERYAPGQAPEDLFFGQEVVVTDTAEYLVDFNPNGDDFIERPLSYIAFETFGIDFYPSSYDPAAGAASGFLPVVIAGTQFQQRGDFTETGRLRELSFGGAFEAEKDIMIGLSTNIVSGSYEMRNIFEEVDDNNENLGFDRLSLTRRQTSNFSGVNLRGGISIRGSWFRVGATIETPTWYSVDEQRSIQMQTVFDNGDRFVYGDDSSEEVGREEDQEYSIRSPWRIGAGGAVQLADATFMVDAIFVDWTRLQLSTSENSGVFDADNQLIEDHFDPVVHFRAGVEYDLDPLALRAGFAYQPSPVSLPDVSPAAGSSSLNLQGTNEVTESTRYYPSIGVGYQLGDQLHLDFSWVQERFEDRFLPYLAQNASYVNEEVVRNRIQVGLRYSF